MKSDPELSPPEWNFDNVPDNELAACCYWEYARESAFIRGLRRRCQEYWEPLFRKPQWWDQPEDPGIRGDMEKVRSIGHAATIFLHGFACPTDGVLPDAPPLKPGEVYRLTGSFPKPWQKLTKEERAFRAWNPPRGIVDLVQLVPFERGICLDAKDIVQSVAKRRRSRDEANAAVRRENPQWSEEALVQGKKLKFPDIGASVIYGSGTENTVVQIHWGLFSNEEIVQCFRKWVKANRPGDVPAPDAKGRNKARDWRVTLERLGMMRLLHHHRLRDLPAACPPASKLFQKREWYKERSRAHLTFRRYFPFLAPDERPISWPSKGGRSR